MILLPAHLRGLVVALKSKDLRNLFGVLPLYNLYSGGFDQECKASSVVLELP
jgi:hypothetical protein